MFFTQEDYKKIQKWLLANSIKDTEFAGADMPLKGNETVAFVQDGKNVSVFLKDLIEQIFLLGVSDFLNVTDKYGESMISLTQAIQLIPYRSRKSGQVITFLDENGDWSIYQFQGKINQWNNTTLWINLINKIKGINIIDSEDIVAKTDDNNQTSLLFADKNYNTADYSGLGRVYLRKNIQRVQNPNTGIFYNTNLLTQQMMTKENTIYIVQYDYSLNFQTVTIPDNSILLFEGGSISNGTIIGNNTIINSELVEIFGDNIKILGVWNTPTLYSNWFKINPADATIPLRNLFKLANSNIFNTIFINSSDINIDIYDSDNNTPISISIPSNTKVVNNSIIRQIPTTQNQAFMFSVVQSEDVEFTGGTLIGDLKSHLSATGEANHGIEVRGSKRIYIHNVNISEFWGDCINVQVHGTSISKDIIVENVNVSYARRNNISIESADGCIIRNSYISSAGAISGTSPKAGIDIEPITGNTTNNVLIDTCLFNNNETIDILITDGGITIPTPYTVTNIEVINCNGNKGVSINNVSNLNLLGSEFNGIGLSRSLENILVDNCRFKSQLFFTEPISNNVTISNNDFNCMFPATNSGIILTYNNGQLNDVLITKNTFTIPQNSTLSSVISIGNSTVLNNVYIDDNDFILNKPNLRIVLPTHFNRNNIKGNFIGFYLNNAIIQDTLNVSGNMIDVSGNSFDVTITSPAINSLSYDFNFSGNKVRLSNASLLFKKYTGVVGTPKIYYTNNIYNRLLFDTNITNVTILPFLDGGSTLNRPTFALGGSIGVKYFNTDINNYVIWDGTYWRNEDGTLDTKVVIV